MKAIVCCIAKQEEDYIKDFCEYHLNLGFDEIHIYDNNELNYPLLSNIITDDRIIIHDFRNITENQQLIAYETCYKTVDYDWCAFIDVDEYITLTKHNNIKDFIMSFDENVDCIRLCWKVIGDDEIIMPSNINIPIYDRLFNESKKYRKSSFKSIVKKTPINLVSAHYFINEKNELLKTVYSDGNIANDKTIWHDGFIEGMAYIRHYMTKTLYEYINQKLYRGTVVGKSKGNNYYRMQYYFGINEITPEKINYLKTNKIDISMLKL